MRVLDLFSGIGGFSLGLERAGHKTIAFCEIDSYCQRVLKRHWPSIICYEDIRTLTADRIFQNSHGEFPDIIAGGFPCQDISVAGKGAGIEGSRSGLWSEYWRLIGEIRPRYVIVENVAALLGRGLERVLGDLASIGYDAEWHCIPAAAIGAPHRRDRIWIVAHPQEFAGGTGLWGHRAWEISISGDGSSIQDAEDYAENSQGIRWGDAFGQWRIEPNVGRVANGIPARVDRLKSLGNSIVPQIAEIIGRALVEQVP